jgi:L-alanine-DL-glutamate epimerase-like enolase superfamily enzyme
MSTAIKRVDVFGYRLTYVHGDYAMSGGRTITALPSTVLRVTTDDGVEGFGETCPLGPAYLPAHAEGRARRCARWRRRFSVSQSRTWPPSTGRSTPR